MKNPIFRSGFVSIVGRPNVGKSTFLNSLLSQKISITSHKPQTTRNTIIGIKNLNNAQAVFIDTPGIHKPKSKLNKYMAALPISTFETADIILFMTDISKKSQKEDIPVLKKIEGVDKKVFLLINKIDLLSTKEQLLSLIKYYHDLFSFFAAFPISAVTKENFTEFEKELTQSLPEGPKYYPDEMITDRPELFFMSEIVREKVAQFVREEIPYGVAVAIKNIEEKKDITVIDFEIYVEKKSQKSIVIGRNGAMLKKIGQRARIDIEKMLQKKVYLTLWVKVKEKWTNDDRSLKELGYTL